MPKRTTLNSIDRVVIAFVLGNAARSVNTGTGS